MKKIKKSLFVLLVCSLILSSCSKFEETSTETSNNSVVSEVSESLQSSDISNSSDLSSVSGDVSDASKEETTSESESSDDDNTMFDFSLLSMEELAEYVTLGQYKGFESEKVVVKLTEEDIDKALKQILQMYGEWKEVTDRPIQKDDRVTMDYVGYLNGEAFDGGTGNDQTIIIGEGRYIDGFEDGLIGVKSGEKISLDLTFPENYGVENLNGKAVVFDITVKKVEEYIYPELTEEIVKDYTKEEITSVEAFIEDVKNDLYEKTLFEAKMESIAEYWQKAVDSATVIKYPDGIIDDYVKSYLDYYTQYATMYGVELEEFLGQSVEEFKKECQKGAEAQYKDRMVFYAAMHEENFDSNIVEEEYNEYLETQAKMMDTTVEYLISQYSVETLEYSYIYDMFRTHLYESRIEIEPTESDASETNSEITSEEKVAEEQ